MRRIGLANTGKRRRTGRHCRKGRTAEQIDDITAHPRPDLSGIVAGRGNYKGKEMTLLTGPDGHWVTLSPEGRVIAVSNRNRPLREKENEPDPIIRPLE